MLNTCELLEITVRRACPACSKECKDLALERDAMYADGKPMEYVYRCENAELCARLYAHMVRSQEAVKPVTGIVKGWSGEETTYYKCRKCGCLISDHDSYCRTCGGAVKWE